MVPELTQSGLERLAEEVGARLKARGELLVTAESCTGGWVGQCLTAIAGSSTWYDGGFITYSNTAKTQFLGVPESTLRRHGAVSEATARAMAQGALARSSAGWSLAITGIAGPGGGSPRKPVGTVCFAWARQEGGCVAETCHFEGDREAVRLQAVGHALRGIRDRLPR
ncbi:MAG: Nicotinamide-nucleotide amidohydrolase PncC [Betaproteobacteria bacterium ADurb.Bin341]|nr:MAG: Nicotinamide-nucleotide amidohydrolase PncC [Betaproteobacteria bacterium ADurb.Bin341]